MNRIYILENSNIFRCSIRSIYRTVNGFQQILCFSFSLIDSHIHSSILKLQIWNKILVLFKNDLFTQFYLWLYCKITPGCNQSIDYSRDSLWKTLKILFTQGGALHTACPRRVWLILYSNLLYMKSVKSSWTNGIYFSVLGFFFFYFNFVIQALF